MSAAAPAHSLRGALLFALGLFLFACMDTTTKYLAVHYPVPLIVAVRYIVHCLLMIVLLAPAQGRRLIQTKRTALVLVRAGCLALASLFMGLALHRMPVAEATAFLFVAPLLVVLIAGPLLGERVGALGWVAAIGGFGGILLIAHPGGGLDPVAIVLALCAAGLTATYQLLSRVLASTERTLTLLFYTALVGAILFGVAVPWYWGDERPGALHLLLFLSLGVWGGLGHFLFTSAHRHAPASLLAPMTYSQLVWAAVLGWIVFGHVPDSAGIVGMGIVAGAGVLVALKSRMQRRALAEPLE